MRFIHVWDLRTDDDTWWHIAGLDLLWVELAPADVKEIRKIGKERSLSRVGSKKNYAKGSELEGNIHGAAAEVVTAWVFKSSLNQKYVLLDSNAADVGNDIEAKSTKYDGRWRLYVNESTMKAWRKYVLSCTFLWPKYVGVIGWAYGSEVDNGPEPLPWRKEERAYWTGKLRPLSELINIDIGPAKIGKQIYPRCPYPRSLVQ